MPNILADPSPNSKLNIAGIGVGGRGGAHVEAFLNENLVAVCDVVEGARNGCLGQIERFNKDHGLSRPLPKSFSDYREMFDKMHGQIDAVFVATPDHHHALASMTAIRLGKHVYCEKPLTHNIREARLLTLAAREHKVATQMGNNGRESEGWRRLCEWIWAGAIGNVQEAHIWTDRAGIPKHFWWPQGGNRPAGADPMPAGLNWDAWLGPAPERPYLNTYKEGKFQGKSVYQPFVWRGWWDFGTGALGDIGCHAMSGLFTALKIEYRRSGRTGEGLRRRDRGDVSHVVDHPLGHSRPGGDAAVQNLLVRRRLLPVARNLRACPRPGISRQRRDLHRRQGQDDGRAAADVGRAAGRSSKYPSRASRDARAIISANGSRPARADARPSRTSIMPAR